MTEVDKNIADGNLTQKEIIQLLLHNAQHMATREEVKSDIKDLKFELKEDISEVEITLKEEISRVETTLKEEISRVETTLKEDISRVETTLKEDILKVDSKISKIEISLKDDNKELSKRMDRFMFWSLGLTITSTFLILGFIYKTIV